MTTSPLAEGAIAAIAGRSIPFKVFSTILESARSAPVLPAEMTPAASPASTASSARRNEESRTLSAAVGLISLGIRAPAWRSVARPCSRLVLASRGVRRASSPKIRKVACGWRIVAISSPSIIAAGALSPPIASTAKTCVRLIPSSGSIRRDRIVWPRIVWTIKRHPDC